MPINVKKYVLDSNVFIQAYRMYYPFDVVPGFWKKIIELSDKGIVISIDKVKKELCDNNNLDDLGIWCTQEMKDYFFVDTTSCIDEYSSIAQWVYSTDRYLLNAKNEFLSTDLADPWLIAYAMKNDYVIVTHEVSDPFGKKKIKIPEPCNQFNITYMNPIDMFREIKETF